jgi:Spy/CpxP family protein refolding chaperone
LHKQIREALESGADQATLDSLGVQLGKMQIAKMQEMHTMHQQFEAILTDEQKAKLAEMKQQRHERWKEHREPRQDSE